MAQPFAIDDELDEERNLLRQVGKAREIPDAFEDCPQSYLEATHHPYAPFTGDAILWNSWVYDDATTYDLRRSVARRIALFNMCVTPVVTLPPTYHDGLPLMPLLQ
jgi:hypothetical protein